MNNYIIMDSQIFFEENYADFEIFKKEKEKILLEEMKRENSKGSSIRMVLDSYLFQDIITLHYTIYIYSGGAHDIRVDRIYYYDLKQQREVELEDLIDINADFTDKIRNFASDYLKKEKKELIYDDEYMFQDGLKEFRYFIFDENSLILLFFFYQVGPWSSGEILVPIPYSDIASFLKI